MISIHRDHKRQKMTTEKLNTTTKKHKLTRVTEMRQQQFTDMKNDQKVTELLHRDAKCPKSTQSWSNNPKRLKRHETSKKGGRSALVSGLLWGGGGSQRHRSDTLDFYMRWTETGTNVWSSFLFMCCDKMNFSGNQPGGASGFGKMSTREFAALLLFLMH